MESTDQHILALLAREGRMSYTDIGRATGLSTSAAQQRVRRLERREVITGYHAQINPDALGRNLTAFISIRSLNPHEEESVPSLLESMPQITSCYSIAGDASYLCKAMVASTSELDTLLNQLRVVTSLITVTTVVLTTYFEDRPPVDPPQA